MKTSYNYLLFYARYLRPLKCQSCWEHRMCQHPSHDRLCWEQPLLRCEDVCVGVRDIMQFGFSPPVASQVLTFSALLHMHSNKTARARKTLKCQTKKWNLNNNLKKIALMVVAIKGFLGQECQAGLLDWKKTYISVHRLTHLFRSCWHLVTCFGQNTTSPHSSLHQYQATENVTGFEPEAGGLDFKVQEMPQSNN